MAEIYRPLSLNDFPVVYTSRRTSELIKYAGNGFLAMKITFINELADLCEKVGADVQQVAKGIGLDGRIGSKFLNPGPGYGGSCFPKDTVALVRTAQQYGAPVRLIETTVEVNDARKKAMADRVIAALGGEPRGKTVGIVGESGCGKSVTAMSIIRLLPQPAGRILGGQVRFKGIDLLRAGTIDRAGVCRLLDRIERGASWLVGARMNVGRKPILLPFSTPCCVMANTASGSHEPAQSSGLLA